MGLRESSPTSPLIAVLQLLLLLLRVLPPVGHSGSEVAGVKPGSHKVSMTAPPLPYTMVSESQANSTSPSPRLRTIQS